MAIPVPVNPPTSGNNEKGPPEAVYVPGVFSLYRTLFAPNFRSERNGGTLDNSLLILRNQIAHGGGLRTVAARHLLTCHQERVYELLRRIAGITATSVIVANSDGHTLRLQGPRPSPMPAPAGMPVGNGPYLLDPAGAALPLWPLADYGPVRRADNSGPLKTAQTPANVQLYLRADRERLVYVPLGSDDNISLSFELERFRTLFQQARDQLGRIAALPAAKEQAPQPRFLVLLDGLDEVLPQAGPGLPNLLRELMLPGTVWLLAGRPDPLFQRAFAPPRSDWVFVDGLPAMSAVDIRAMLIEGLPNSRYALVARDRDGPSGVFNPFIDRVVACADGLPLYIHLLLDDLRNGRLSVHDEQRLPNGLTAYHQSFRDFISGDDARPAPDNLRLTIDSAQNRLCRLAAAWEHLPRGNLRNHLFRPRHRLCATLATGTGTGRRPATLDRLRISDGLYRGAIHRRPSWPGARL